MKKLRGGNDKGDGSKESFGVFGIISLIFKIIIYVILVVCFLIIMFVVICFLICLYGGFVFTKFMLRIINILSGGFNDIFPPMVKGIIGLLKKIGMKAKPVKLKIPKIPENPIEIILDSLGIPPEEKEKREVDVEVEDDDEDDDEDDYIDY